LGLSTAKSRRYLVYLFRAMHPTSRKSMLACVAPYGLVVSSYGGNSGITTTNILAAFGALSIYKSAETTNRYLGVWGPRKAETFLDARRHAEANIEVVRHPPPAHLILFRSTHGSELSHP